MPEPTDATETDAADVPEPTDATETDAADVPEPDDVAVADALDVGDAALEPIDAGPKESPFADVPPSPTVCAEPPPATETCDKGVELVYEGSAFPIGKGYWGGVYLGDHLYAGGGTSSLNVWDMKDPTTPAMVGAGVDPAYQPITDGAYVYADGGWWSGMRVYDVSVPTEPTIVGWGPLTGTLFHAGGGRVYGLGAGLTSYDVSDPTAPASLGFWVHTETVLHAAGAAGDIVVFRGSPAPGAFEGYLFGAIDFRDAELDPALVYGETNYGPTGGTSDVSASIS